jgi:hypothetical protein
MKLVTELYRHFDKDGRLLYVGISFNSWSRWCAHKSNGAEWTSVSTRMEIERFPSRQEALAAERKAIIAESPLYNVMFVPRPPSATDPPVFPKRPAVDKGPRTLVLQAYDKVLSRVEEIYFEKYGKIHGSKAWLADQLGTSRQTVDNWGNRAGFPERHVKKISKITDLTHEQVHPDTVIVQLPVDVWNEICEAMPDLAARCTILSDRRNR